VALREVALDPQFLKDSPIHFDLVVFDEASQIITEDAIGAVMRGNQLVVAGDEKQLPPTSFFQASQVDDSDGDDDEDDSTEQPDYESVLAACSTVLPQKMLRWHYRSRHEGLIPLSNARFYESRLVTVDGDPLRQREDPVRVQEGAAPLSRPCASRTTRMGSRERTSRERSVRRDDPAAALAAPGRRPVPEGLRPGRRSPVRDQNL
jgi:superfamily I DNA and/or RNA helicase